MFEELIRKGLVRKGTPDLALAKSLIAMSMKNMRYASSNEIDDDNASPVLVNYYEALREICEAICSINGYKVYSHEAFTSYLKDKLGEERVAEIFDRLRKLRNGINYYGESVNVQEAVAASADVKRLIEFLKSKYLLLVRG